MADNQRIEDLRRRVLKDPASIAFAQLAEECRRVGQYEEAIATCRAGLAIHPGYLSARVTLGRALIELDQLDEAQAELEVVLKSAAENLAAIRGLAEIFHRRGALADALKQYRAALALARNDPDLERTVTELSRAIEPKPPAPVTDGLSFEQLASEFLTNLSPPPPVVPSISVPDDTALAPAVSDTVSDAVPDTVSDVAPDAVSDPVPDPVPGTGDYTFTDAVDQQALEAQVLPSPPEPDLIVASEPAPADELAPAELAPAVLDTVSDAAPDAVSDTVLDTVSDAVPDTGSHTSADGAAFELTPVPADWGVLAQDPALDEVVLSTSDDGDVDSGQASLWPPMVDISVPTGTSFTLIPVPDVTPAGADDVPDLDLDLGSDTVSDPVSDPGSDTVSDPVLDPVPDASAVVLSVAPPVAAPPAPPTDEDAAPPEEDATRANAQATIAALDQWLDAIHVARAHRSA